MTHIASVLFRVGLALIAIGFLFVLGGGCIALTSDSLESTSLAVGIVAALVGGGMFLLGILTIVVGVIVGIIGRLKPETPSVPSSSYWSRGRSCTGCGTAGDQGAAFCEFCGNALG